MANPKALKLFDVWDDSEDAEDYDKWMASEMRVSIVHGDRRFTLDIDAFQRVRGVKEKVRTHFHLGPDEGPAGAEIQEKKILTLSYAGADLNDDHWFGDLGIVPGSTIKVVLREEIKPSVYLHTVFNGKVIPVLESIHFKSMLVTDFRSLASQKSGLPVGAFRMLNPKGQELFDGHCIDDYGIEIGCTVDILTWDGWNELLNLCMLGFSSQALQHVSSNEQIQRFQLKVMLYMAAHFNHVDLAVSILRSGIRADEAVGDHPFRQWCRTTCHIDSQKAPIHVAAEAGSLGVLRSFVHNNLMNVLAKDGKGLTPLNIALRKKQKPCASFLLTKQWSKINYTKKHAIPLSIYVKIRRWADRSRDKAYVIHGAWKSSLKNPRKFIQTGALVGLNLQVDGFTPSKMSSKTESQTRYEQEQEEILKQKVFDFSDDLKPEVDPEQYFKSLYQITSVKLPRITKFGKIMAKQASQSEVTERNVRDYTDGDELYDDVLDEQDETEDGTSGKLSPDAKRKIRSRSESQYMDEKLDQRSVRFPPIQHHQRVVKSLSVANLNTPKDADSKMDSKKPMYIKTGGGGGPHSVKSALTAPTPTPSRRPPSKSSKTLDTTSRRSKEDASETSRRDNKQEGDQTQRKRKREMISQSEAMLAKARSETHNIPLPVQSWCTNPRPFVNPKYKEIQETLRMYEKQRGMTSRDYAISCLSVANSFKEKPWLSQLHQALTIAQRGVKKTVSNCPHMFKVEAKPVTPKSVLGTFTDIEDSSSRTFMTA